MPILQQLSPIVPLIKWGAISQEYFGLSRSWIYQRLNGYDGNGNPSEFTPVQKHILADALRDIAAKLTAAAAEIEKS